MDAEKTYRYYFEIFCFAVGLALVGVVFYHQSLIGNLAEYRNRTLIQVEVILLLLTMFLFVVQSFRLLMVSNRNAWRASAITATCLGGTVLWALWYDMATFIYAT